MAIHSFRNIAAILILAPAFMARAQIVFPTNPPAPPQGPRWIQPTSATGEGIQAAIAEAYRTGARVYIPGGTYLIGKTIDFKHLGPVLIEGEQMAATDGFRGKGGVELKWTGEAGGTMFRLNALGVQFKNLTLNGNRSAGVGVQFWTDSGWGTAVDSFDHVIFTYIKGECVKAGTSPREVNAADLFFDQCIFQMSDVGFRVVHDQGLNYHFDRCQFFALKTAIQADRGGAIFVRGGGGGACDTFIRTGEGGHNTGPITVRDFRFENGGYTKKFGQILDAPDSPGGTRIIFDGFHQADGGHDQPDARTPMFKVGAHVMVHIRDSLLKRAGEWPLAEVNGSDQYPAILMLDNVDPGTDVTQPGAIVHNATGHVGITPAGEGR